MEEFVVTLYNHEDLDQFYQEMENSGEYKHLPNRPVECCNKRKISRNTHYLLSYEEALSISGDNRVRAITLTPERMGYKPEPISVLTNKKGNNYYLGESNYGMETLVNGVNNTADRLYTAATGETGISAYDYDTSAFYADRQFSGTIKSLATRSFSTIDTNNNRGKNVDVVIADGHMDGSHLEFRKNTSTLTSDVVRLPEKIMVSGFTGANGEVSGRVLNLTFQEDADVQISNINHFYTDGVYKLVSQIHPDNSFVSNTDGLTGLHLVLHSGEFRYVAERRVKKPPILDQGYTYNFEYNCPLTAGGVTSLRQYNSGDYTGDGLMSNGYKIIRYRDASMDKHTIIPAFSKFQYPPDTQYANSFYIKNRVSGEGPFTMFGGFGRMNLQTEAIAYGYIAPDIFSFTGRGEYNPNNSLRQFSPFLSEGVMPSDSFSVISRATGTTTFTRGVDSRLIEYSWFSGYQYRPANTQNSNHGMHVGATACGNTQGLASEANIYNIEPFDGQVGATVMFDYIRAFHTGKPINPETNRRNPTVVNNSWSYKDKSVVTELTGIRNNTFPKFTGGHRYVGDTNPAISGTLNLKISGKVNVARNIGGNPAPLQGGLNNGSVIDDRIDSTRLIIGGDFTGISLNGTGYGVRNLFALDLHNNSMLKHPLNSNYFYFGNGVNGPVETILTHLTSGGFNVTNDTPYSKGTILIGGQFDQKYGNQNSNSTATSVNNLMALSIDTADFLESSKPLFTTGLQFTGAGAKIRKISRVRDDVFEDKYCFLGDFTGYTGDAQRQIIVTNTGFDKTGFMGSGHFTPPAFISTNGSRINDFDTSYAGGAHSTGTDFGGSFGVLGAADFHNSMMIGGLFTGSVGSDNITNVCALNATGGVTAGFAQNFNGTDGEVNAIIHPAWNSKIGADQYIVFGDFNSGNAGDERVTTYNLKGGTSTLNELALPSGIITKAEVDQEGMFTHGVVHLYSTGGFTRIGGDSNSIRNVIDGYTTGDVNRLTNSVVKVHYCTLENFLYKQGKGARDYEESKNRRRLDLIPNYGHMVTGSNALSGIQCATQTFYNDFPLQPKNKSLRFRFLSFDMPRAVTLLGETVPGNEDVSIKFISSTISDHKKEIAEKFGVVEGQHRYTQNMHFPSIISDMEDCVNDGIVFINSAGNDNRFMCPSGHPNFAKAEGLIPLGDFSIYFGANHITKINSAGTPASVGINVGSLSVDTEEKGLVTRSTFSNYGPQVHVFAPGENILGAVNRRTDFSPFSTFGGQKFDELYTFVPSGAFYDKYDGTSMAAPQVCGLTALFLSNHPELNQEDIKNVLQNRSVTGKIFDPSTGFVGSGIPLNNINMYDTPNIIPQYWDFRKLRSVYKVSYPQNISVLRGSSGVLYPKIKNKF